MNQLLLRLPLVALALAAAMLLSSVAAASAATHSVSVRNDYFSARSITIRAGDKVLWIWRSRGRKHNVASSAFGDSGNRRHGSFSVTFGSAGTYSYFCGLHRGMTGTVVVRR